MEYIQCPHCLKKYGVNDKIRGASGKTIRCQGCQEPFEITVFSTPSPQPSSEEDNLPEEKEQPAATEKKVAKKSAGKAQKSPGRKSHKKLFQIIITSVLGVVLIIALVVAYQLLDNPLPLEATQTEATQTEASQTGDSQIDISQTEIKQPENEQSRKESTESSQSDVTIDQPEEARPQPATSDLLVGDSYLGPSNPSDGCKQAATNQWFTDYMITNGNMTGKEYVRLLDESSNQTELVLKLCKDKYLASRITDAARLGKSPVWIEAEIEARTSNRYENKAINEDEW